jgi:hypothetical protein
MLVLVPKDRSTDQAVDALAARMQTLPAQLRWSLSWDRSYELAGPQTFHHRR